MIIAGLVPLVVLTGIGTHAVPAALFMALNGAVILTGVS